MTAIASTLEAIAAAPRGRRTAALFDLDGTLLGGYSAVAFYRDRLRRRDVGLTELARSLAVAADAVLLGGDPGRLGPIAIKGLKGQRREDLEEVGRRLYASGLDSRVRAHMRALVHAHQRRGHTVAVASSATRFQVGPIADGLGIDHVLCTETECEDGRLTGNIETEMLWGPAKARAVRRFARDHRLDLRRSFAYANGDEDVPFLAAAGRPHAVNPGPLLERVALAEDWPILRLRDPDGNPLRAALGTVAAIGGMNVGLAIAYANGVVHGDRRVGANAAAPAYDLALALAGVSLRVHGEENLWAQRPAVFVFNHQSNLDPLVTGALLRRDFTATGKVEARRDPGGALAGLVMDAIYLDRANPQAAKRELARAVERLRGGESVMVAPEGTRNAALGDFKHGAFHVAMQAGVPVVPVVLRNTGELMGRRAKSIRPGVVDVAVLEPIATTRWKTSTMGRHVAAVRQGFEQTLDGWPGE